MLGSLVRAALGCHDVAVAWSTPFISGKDSLNNEFSYVDASGRRQTVSIPPSLLITPWVRSTMIALAVTMDAKEAGNLIYLVGQTRAELGGSHFALVNDLEGGAPAGRSGGGPEFSRPFTGRSPSGSYGAATT